MLDKRVEQFREHCFNNGSTFSFNGENLVGKKFYSVGINQEQKIKGKITFHIFKKYFDESINFSEHLNQDHYGVGTWFDIENNCTYLDVVAILESKDNAIQVAKRNKEIAFYDLFERELIYL